MVMSLHKKTHRILLVISFIYLTMCPVSQAVYADLHETVLAGIVIQTQDGRHQRGHGVQADTRVLYFPNLLLSVQEHYSILQQGHGVGDSQSTIPVSLLLFSTTHLLL